MILPDTSTEKARPLYSDPTWLQQKRRVEGLSLGQMAQVAECSLATVRLWLWRYNISLHGYVKAPKTKPLPRKRKRSKKAQGALVPTLKVQALEQKRDNIPQLEYNEILKAEVRFKDHKGSKKICRTLTSHQKEQVLERDGYVCVYCLGEATVVDHIIPWSWRFNDDPGNLVAACEICNTIAGSLIFPSLKAKRLYILKERGLTKWRPHWPPARCSLCGQKFAPGVEGATNLLCGSCYKMATHL